jgi:hypothetical protein
LTLEFCFDRVDGLLDREVAVVDHMISLGEPDALGDPSPYQQSQAININDRTWSTSTGSPDLSRRRRSISRRTRQQYEHSQPPTAAESLD